MTTPAIIVEARRIAALSVHATETEYRALRDRLQEEYASSAGPHAQRNRTHEIAKRRAAAGRPAERADRLEQEGEEFARDYDESVRLKALLALRTGRYDEAICDDSRPMSGTAPGLDEAVALIIAARRAELACSAEGCDP